MDKTEKEPKYDYRYKILLFGYQGVGKTSLLNRYTEDTFLDDSVREKDYKTKLIDMDGKKVYLKIEIWDKYSSKTYHPNKYRGVHGIILVYDITNEQSFNHVDSSWLSNIEEHSSYGVVKMLVGNKTDLDISRCVKKATAARLAEDMEMEYQETSAKTGVNVDEIFESLVRSIISKGNLRVIKLNRTSQSQLNRPSQSQLNHPSQNHSSTDYDYQFKIILLGDPGVGKASLISRYTEDTFSDRTYCGVDRKTKLIDVDGKKIYLEICDNIFYERPFVTMPSTLYRANAIILVYDITDEHSFDNVDSSWLSKIEDYEGVKMLVGNKTDLDISRSVEKATAARLAEDMEMEYHETSAKTGVNVDEMFESLVRSIISKAKEKADPTVLKIHPVSQRLNPPSQGHSFKCCANA